MKYIYLLLIVFFMCPLDVKATNEEILPFSCGTGCTWEKKGTKLIITATEGAVMDDFEEKWNAERRVYETTAPWGADFTEIEIVGGLTNISKSAFEGAQFTSVNIPDTVTSIGEDAFSWNFNLSSVSLPNSVASISKWAFAKDKALTNIVFPSSVISVGDVVFTGATGLTSVVVENSNTALSENVFGGILGNVYCQNFEQCKNKGITDQNIIVFSKTEDGVYQIGDKYFASVDLMLLGNDWACDSLEQCKKALSAMQSGKTFRIGNKLYASLHDALAGNYIQKRIYTIEEASKLSKPTGNTFRLRYK
ncbi:MAG: leucine-rich repeat domain-containing protein [Alphaproteobacteria bacterium]|nr:leucine-rich repeat domain-containing protein [Alphaproteobacteria bacterium]